MAIGAVALCGVQATAWAEGSVAVLAVSHDGQAPPAGAVEQLVAAIESNPGTYVMPPQEAVATLSAGQLLSLDSVRPVVSDIQQAIDFYYEAETAKASELLEPALERGLSQPMLLALSDTLSSAVKEGLLTAPRLHLAEARFDEAAAVAYRLVEVFPTAEISRKQYPPNVVDLVEQNRSKHASLANRLRVAAAAVDDAACMVNINGEKILVERGGEREVPVSAQDYGVMMHCGEQEPVGPYLVSMTRARMTLPVSTELVEALATAQTAQPMVLPSTFGGRLDLGQLLTQLLNVDEVILVGSNGGDGMLAVRVTRDGESVQARLDEVPTLESAKLLHTGLERGRPVGDVAVDTGSGWTQAESPSYVVEYVVLGTGAATLITGAVFLGLAANQADVVRECMVPGACRESTSEENGELYASNQFAGELLMALGGTMVAAGGTVLLVRWLMADDLADDELAGVDDLGVTYVPNGALATWRMSW